MLREAYGEYLTGLTLDNCEGMRSKRCLINVRRLSWIAPNPLLFLFFALILIAQRVLRLWDERPGPHQDDDMVFMTRPDIHWCETGPFPEP